MTAVRGGWATTGGGADEAGGGAASGDGPPPAAARPAQSWEQATAPAAVSRAGLGSWAR
ncbi:hypothetical protein BZL29_6145 [Mycobacterium kansasii]|uniref:Uncharacterized protein n=1 Tax=Mycobacterium kansasii TaxID=1768 RepID=A0A1V3WSQ3_MYCKA|nr:hypothetical protein BZL29_6145 [Mycobacterium kansasii]